MTTGARQTRTMIIYQKWRQLQVWHYRDCREAPKGYPIRRTGEFRRVATGIDERRNLDSDHRVLNISPGSIPVRWPVLERDSKMPRKCLGRWRGKLSLGPFSPGRETSSIILYTGVLREWRLLTNRIKIMKFINKVKVKTVNLLPEKKSIVHSSPRLNI